MKKKKSKKNTLGSLVGVDGRSNGKNVEDYLFDSRVPVLYPDGTPAMPTKVSRALEFIKSGKAKKHRTDFGTLCIKLIDWPAYQQEQQIVIGVDPGRSYTGIAVQSSRYTLMGLHVSLPVQEKKTISKGGRVRSDIKQNRECENFLCKTIMSIFPISLIVLEVSKTNKPRSEWNPTLVGQDWQFKRLKKIVETKIVDGVQTSYYRKHLGLYKQKKRKGEIKPETQVVDGIALGASGFLDDRSKKIKIKCRLTHAPFIVLSKSSKVNDQRNVLGLSTNSITQVDYPEALKIREKDNVRMVSEKDEEEDDLFAYC